jgi:putative signal transducing protein
MIELIRTNDLVLIGLVESLLADAGIGHFVADAHMSALEGSIGAFQRRILVAQDQLSQARRVLVEAGLAGELRGQP